MRHEPPKLLELRPLQDFRLWLRYDDGAEGEVDLSDLAGHGVFTVWDTPGAFQAGRLEPHGAVAWGDDVDLCGDALYLRLTGKNAEDIFSALGKVAVDA